MAKGLAEAGVKVIAVFDTNQELGDAAAEELNKKADILLSSFMVDVTDTTAVNTAFGMFGTPDVLVNSAGSPPFPISPGPEALRVLRPGPVVLSSLAATHHALNSSLAIPRSAPQAQAPIDPVAPVVLTGPRGFEGVPTGPHGSPRCLAL